MPEWGVEEFGDGAIITVGIRIRTLSSPLVEL